MILTSSDKATFFPDVSQTGAALDGLLYFVQATCQGSFGANRPLELQQFTHIITINPAFYTGNIPMMPIASSPAPTVESRIHTRYLGQYTSTDWQATDQFAIDAPTGQIHLKIPASEVKLTYWAGFNFTAPTDEAKEIKAIAGVVLDWAARRFYGQLDSYLDNPPGAQVSSYNYTRLDQWLQTILAPLKKYAPRSSGG